MRVRIELWLWFPPHALLYRGYQRDMNNIVYCGWTCTSVVLYGTYCDAYCDVIWDILWCILRCYMGHIVVRIVMLYGTYCGVYCDVIWNILWCVL